MVLQSHDGIMRGCYAALEALCIKIPCSVFLVNEIARENHSAGGSATCLGGGGTGTVGAQLETRPKTHLPRKFRFCSDFVHLILGILGRNQE